jgi:hypothetical protein
MNVMKWFNISNKPVINSESEVLVLTKVLLASQPQFDDFELIADLPLKLQVQTNQHYLTTDLEVHHIPFKCFRANTLTINNIGGLSNMYQTDYHKYERK